MLEMTIMQAWNELKGIEYRINLFETLREVNGDLKTSKIKEILVEGGFITNNEMLNIISKKDEYTERLQSLYQSKRAYEEFIENEIERLKISDIHIVVGFLKEYKKMKWRDISKKLNYSIAQLKRFYSEYKGKTSESNKFIKNEPL